MCYSVQHRGRIFAKGYRFLSFPKNIGKSIGRNISKKLSDKYSQKLPDHAKQSATDALKTTSKRLIHETIEEIGDLIGNKIANRIMKVSRSWPQKNSETITNEHDKEIPKKRYMPPEEGQKNFWWSKVIMIV